MRRTPKFVGTLAAATLVLPIAFTGAGLAQTAETGAGGIRLPAVLAEIGLVVDEHRSWDHGNVEVSGTLPDGTRIEAHYDDEGLEEIEVRGRHATLPISLIDVFVPEASVNNPQLSHITRLTEIDIDSDGEVEVEGFSVDGHEIKAEFDRAGRMVEFKRD